MAHCCSPRSLSCFMISALFLLLSLTGSAYSTKVSLTHARRGPTLADSIVNPALVSSPTVGFTVVMPSTLVSGIHATVTFLKSVLILDRTDVVNSPPGKFKFPDCVPNKKVATSCAAYAAELYFDGRPGRALDVKSNVFCSAGVVDSTGTIWSIGGNTSPDAGSNLQFQGADHTRIFVPCSDGGCDFTIGASLTSKRWYPSTANLPDGRILVVSGANCTGAIAYNTVVYNNPTYEFIPRQPGESYYQLDVLKKNVMYNLYPHVHVLTDGNIFIFAQDWVVLNYKTNTIVKSVTAAEKEIRCYPHAGASVLLPLTLANKYTDEVLICGGSIGDPLTYKDKTGINYWNQKNLLPGADTCIRINPTTGTIVKESMLGLKRVMPDMNIWPDGSVEVLNGATFGFGGLKLTYARNPVLMPLTYYPDRAVNKRFTQVFKKNPTSIPRGYHSSTLLMPDGCLFISGSNPNQPPIFAAPRSDTFFTEMRGERYCPSYFSLPASQPILDDADTVIILKTGSSFSFSGVSTTSPAAVTGFKVAIINPGFSTHSSHFSQRYIELPITSITRNASAGFSISTRIGDVNLLPPGQYFLYLLYGGKPCISARPVFVTL